MGLDFRQKGTTVLALGILDKDSATFAGDLCLVLELAWLLVTKLERRTATDTLTLL